MKIVDFEFFGSLPVVSVVEVVTEELVLVLTVLVLVLVLAVVPVLEPNAPPSGELLVVLAGETGVVLAAPAAPAAYAGAKLQLSARAASMQSSTSALRWLL